MKLGKKGLTLIELIVTITLISLLLLFLFKILNTVNGEDKLDDKDIELLSIKSSVTKNLEKIFIDKEINQLSEAAEYYIISNGEKFGSFTIFYDSENKEEYTLPDGYFFGYTTFNNNENYVYSIEIPIKHGKGSKEETLDDRYTIKLYYYGKN